MRRISSCFEAREVVMTLVWWHDEVCEGLLSTQQSPTRTTPSSLRTLCKEVDWEVIEESGTVDGKMFGKAR